MLEMINLMIFSSQNADFWCLIIPLSGQIFTLQVTYDNINKTALGRDGVGLFVTEDINNQLRAGDR